MNATEKTVLITEYFDTLDLKLGALLLAQIPGSKFKVSWISYSSRKKITITFDSLYKADVQSLVSQFIDHSAKADIFLYNRALSQIRDEIHGKNERCA